MKKFSNFITESTKQYSSDDLTANEIKKYVETIKNKLPVNVSKLLYLTSKYNLTTAEQLDEIRNASKGQLKKLIDTLNTPLQDLEEMWQMFKDIKQQFRLMPQYMTNSERKAFMSGKLRETDLTIDLNTTAGRNAVARMYTPILIKIVNQYVGQSNLDRSDLMSAGMEGMVDAMNKWSPEGKDGKDPVPFKTFISYRIRQHIQNEINNNGHALSGTSWYSRAKGDKVDAISIDGLNKDEQDMTDKLAFLGVEDDENNPSEEEKAWKQLYSMLEKQFSHRDIDIFYRYLGLNGRKREKAGDIAKSHGISQSVINNNIMKKIIKYLTYNKHAAEILDTLKDIYLEGLLVTCLGMDKEHIYETLANDDVYLMFEAATPWSNPSKFKAMYAQAQASVGNRQDLNTLLEVVTGDFSTADKYIKTHKSLYINFLKRMYPAEPIHNASDVTLLELMVQIQDAYKKFI